MGIKTIITSLTDTVRIPAAFAGLFKKYRYKVFYGGRGGAKSWSFADALITLAMQKKLRILCARELQRSIKDSVHKLLSDRIMARGLGKEFIITDTSIRCKNGSEFFFAGLRHNITEIKSFEGIDIVWVEEAQRVSQDSWDVLLPTIRKEGSEIWISFNPGSPNDPTWTMFVENPRPGSLVVKVTYRDNPFFTSVLEAERLACLAVDPDKYAWIWEGEPRVMHDAQIFNGRWRVERFDIPTGVRFYQGSDWGVSTVLMRAYIHQNLDGTKEIRVCNEAYGRNTEIDDIPALFNRIPFAAKWLTRGDCARPELIRYMRRRKFAMKPCKKWPGCVEEGNSFLRSLGLVIHPDCVETIKEAELYSYKVDPLTKEVLYEHIVDANNHCFDSLRYAFEPYILDKRAA